MKEGQVLLALNWLACDVGSVILGDEFGVGLATVSRIKRAFVSAVFQHSGDTLNPNSASWLGLDIPERRCPFNRAKYFLFSEASGAADGVHFPLHTRYTSDAWID